MAPVVRRVYDQMLEPKWVIAMGACSSSAGCSPTTPWSRAPTSSCRSTSTCPAARRGPRPLLHGFNKLQRLVRGQPDLGWRQRYNAIGTEEWARFEERQADAGGDRAAEAVRAAMRGAPRRRSRRPE